MRLICIMLVVACSLLPIAAQTSTPYQMNRLGFLPGDGSSYALRINNTGEIIGNSVSYNELPNDTRGAFLWNSTSGMADIRIEGQLDHPGDINKYGQIVGTADSGYGVTTAVLRETSGGLTQLNPITEGAYGTFANAINDSRWVVGTSGDYAVMWQGNTTAQMIGGNPGSYSYATDINNQGSIAWVESLYDTNHQWVGTRSYIWNQGISTMLQSLNADNDCQVNSINDSGVVVGSSGEHAVVWGSDGRIILDLGVGTAYGINESGQIVGVSENKATLWNADGSIAADLSALAGTNTSSIAYAINDSGQIVGAAGYDQYQHMEAVLWTQTQVPEPSSIIALLCGIGGFAGCAVCRKRK